MMAFEFTLAAVDHLLHSKHSNKIVTFQKGECVLMEIDEVVSTPYKLPQKYIDAINYLD
jgi:6-phosphofructokinase 1